MKLDELKKYAEAATPGNYWFKKFHRGGDSYGPEDTLRGPFFHWLRFVSPSQTPPSVTFDPEKNAAFIAAANPDTVLKLLARIEALQGVLEQHSRPPHDCPNLQITPSEECLLCRWEQAAVEAVAEHGKDVEL